MKSGKLDRRIEIQRHGPDVDDGYTVVSGALTTFATRWASWKPANGREVFENLGREAKSAGSFWVRYDTETASITPEDKVSYGGKIWDIVSVNEIGREDGIELIVVAGDE